MKLVAYANPTLAGSDSQSPLLCNRSAWNRHYVSLDDQVTHKRQNGRWRKREEGKISAGGDGIELLMVPAQFSSERNASLCTMLASVHVVF